MVPFRMLSSLSLVFAAAFFSLPSSAQSSNTATIVFGEDEHIVIVKSNLKPADRKLFLAAIDGDLAGLEAAVKEGGNVNVKDHTGETPLWHMAGQNNLAMVEALVRHGANVNYRHKERGDGTVLTVAISHGRVEIAELLLNKGAKAVDPIDLMRAIWNRWDNLAFLLLKKGMPVKTKRLQGNVPLIGCVDMNGNIELMKLLIKKGVDINARGPGGYTALHFAVARKNHDAAGLLLKKKAKKDLKAADGKTAVDFARELGDERMRKLFGLQ